MATPRLPRHSTFLSLRLDSWWSHPFVLESPDPPSVPDLHALLGERLGRTSANVFYLSGNTSDPSDVRRMSVGRALRRLDGEVPSYTIATVSPRRWRTLLALLGSPEPQVWGPMVDRRRLPERECEAALAAANVTAAFEKAIHWRMLAIGGGAGAGMGLHVDSPPVSNLHLQLRGRKEWTLCPPPGRPTAAGAGAGCMREIVGAGSTLFYPEGWSHATRTLDAWAVSLSRSLLAPSGTTAFASAMRAFCAAAAALGDSHALVCEALRPCLRRLQGAHREKGR